VERVDQEPEDKAGIARGSVGQAERKRPEAQEQVPPVHESTTSTRTAGFFFAPAESEDYACTADNAVSNTKLPHDDTWSAVKSTVTKDPMVVLIASLEPLHGGTDWRQRDLIAFAEIDHVRMNEDGERVRTRLVGPDPCSRQNRSRVV